MISCDTSFLASLYLVDTHTPKARAKLRQIRPPEELMLSPFHQYELPNAVRLSVLRGSLGAICGDIGIRFPDCWYLSVLCAMLSLVSLRLDNEARGTSFSWIAKVRLD